MPNLTVTDLFTPAPSGVSANGIIPSVPPQGTWLAAMLVIAARVQLPTTAWQSGTPELTIIATEAVTFAQSDVNISSMAQGGFLQSAASGTVTYTTPAGVTVTLAVTPDPSNASQNPTGALGWLDLLASNVYDVERLSASAATGPLAIANLKGQTLTYAAGAYHAANATTGATYTNTTSLSIPSSSLGSGGVVTGVSTGAQFSTITTGAAHGVSQGQTVYVVIPTSSGITGLAGTFAAVTAVTSNTLTIQAGSSGTWTSGGTVYLCTVTSMAADVVGLGSNAGPGEVTTQITQNANVFVDNVVAWNGSNWESNASLANRCVLSLAARSPNGPAQAYVYFAETVVQFLAAETPSVSLQNGPVTAETFASPTTGVVTTVIASTTPASIVLGDPVTPGAAQDPVTGVTNANPCVITCANNLGWSSYTTMTVTVSGVLGVSTANGTFTATKISNNSFSIQVDTSAETSYSGGGSVEAGDLGQIDQLLQQNVVPENTDAVTVSAVAFPITVVATVIVPQVNVTTYQAAVVPALQAELANYPIGGETPDFAVAWNDILGALTDAGVLVLGAASYARVQSLSVSGNATTITTSGSSIGFPTNTSQAILATPTVNVVGV